MTGVERVAIDVEAVSDQPAPPDAFLSVRDLQVQFPTEDGIVQAVNGINLRPRRGQTLGIVGESGSGKSVTSQAILGLLKGTSRPRSPARYRSTARIWSGASEADMREAARRRSSSMIFQDPLSSMHPFYKIGDQISEAYLVHNHVRQESRAQGDGGHAGPGRHPESGQPIQRLPAPVLRRHAAAGHDRHGAHLQPEAADRRRADDRARCHRPGADPRPDQRTCRREFNSAVILITHDLGVVAETCDKVLVMYGGQCVEMGTSTTSSTIRRCPTPGACSARCRGWTASRQARLQPIAGQPPSLIQVPKGCVFNPRCRFTDRVPGNACRRCTQIWSTTAGRVTPCAVTSDSVERQRIWSPEIARSYEPPRARGWTTADDPPKPAPIARPAERRPVADDPHALLAVDRVRRSTSRSSRASCSSGRSARCKAVDGVSFSASSRRDARPGR